MNEPICELVHDSALSTEHFPLILYEQYVLFYLNKWIYFTHSLDKLGANCVLIGPNQFHPDSIVL